MRIQGIIVLLSCIGGIAIAQNADSLPVASDDSTSITTATAVRPASLQSTDSSAIINEAQSSTVVPDTVASASKSISANVVKTADSSASSSDTMNKGPVIEEIEEDLILDGGEESILTPVAAEPPVQPLPVPDDSTAQQQTVGNTDSTDSLAEKRKKMISHYPAEAMPKVENTPKPLLIEKTRSINFAKNFKEYRSPKLAILLSLLVPGTGQAYAHHKLKAGIFGAVEVAFITAGAIVGYQGTKHVNAARSFADDHYSLDSMSAYHQLLTGLETDSGINFDTAVFYGEYNQFESDASGKKQSYYDNIKQVDGPYIQGWDDVIPRPGTDFSEVYATDSGTYVFSDNPDSIYLAYFINNEGDTVDAQFGFSDNQHIYRKKLSKANSFFNWSRGLFSMLLINHIVSAVDAGITAKAYNDKLLGKSSFWQNINLKEKVVSTPAGPAQGYTLEVRF